MVFGAQIQPLRIMQIYISQILTLFHKEEEQPGTGVLIYIHKTLTCNLRNDLFVFDKY